MAKTYENLNAPEKHTFKQIEKIYIETHLNVKSFVKVLGILINKYKR